MPVTRPDPAAAASGHRTPALGGIARGALLAATPVLLSALRGRGGKALLSALGAGSMERLPAQLLGAGRRHPLAPAALRIERSRSREDDADQVAVTVWFGDGPGLPGVHGRGGARSVALRVGASLLGAVAVAAATSAASRLAEQERPRIVEATPARRSS